MRRWLIRIAALVAATIVVAIAAVIALVVIEPRPAVEFFASQSLDRRVTASNIKIGWGKPLTVEISNLRVANPSWASEPDMIRIEYFSADIDTDSLWHGVMRYNRLRIEKARVLLERGAGEARNWRFPGGGSAEGGLAVVPKNRTQFPTLIDLALRNGQIVMRAPQRRDIRIDFHTLTARTRADDQPVRLAVDGAYNAAPVRMTIDTDPVTRLRDRSVPFGAKVSIGTVPGSIDFTGTLVEPLDFEGVHGDLRIDAQNTGDLLKIFSADLPAAFSLRIAGAFDKQGEHWQIATAKGNVAGSDFTGAVALTEGGRGEPDDVVTTLAFNHLFLQPLLGKGSDDPNKPRGLEAISLKPEDKPGITGDARITAAQFIYGSGELADFALEARSRPGELTIGKLAFDFAGGRIEGSGGTRSAGTAGRAAADVAFAGLDADQLVQLLKGPPGQLAGRVNGRAVLEMTGTTAKDGLQQSSGEAVLAMAQGQVARDLVEKASTDLRTLFRKGEGVAQLSCLVGYVELENGRATIAPLRLRTPEAASTRPIYVRYSPAAPRAW